MAAKLESFLQLVDTDHVASVIRNRLEKVLVIDSRSFLEFNDCHILSAVNVCCSKLVKRRLQQNKLSVKDFLMHTCHIDVDESNIAIVYDQGSPDYSSLPVDSFLHVLLMKLYPVFQNVYLLSGGFLEFQAAYPELCEDKSKKFPALTSLSQPCLPISNIGPTRILPFLYLGSQQDANNKDLLRDHSITYELNVSISCPQPNFIQEGHFMRIPVNDSYNEKLLPHFVKAFQFLDKVRQSSGCVLVHCLAGISRSPTVAIAYVMRHLKMSGDDAYRYVKSKRATISPNFNFLGQLLEYEKQLRAENVLERKEPSTAPILGLTKRQYKSEGRISIPRSVSLSLKQVLDPVPPSPEQSPDETEHGENKMFIADMLPTAAFSKLNFQSYPCQENNPSGIYSISGNEKTFSSDSYVSVVSKRTYSNVYSSEHSHSLSALFGNTGTTESRSELQRISVTKSSVSQTLTSVKGYTSEVKTCSEVQSSTRIPIVSVCVSTPVANNLIDITDSKPNIREIEVPVTGIPVSSLSDISFTPCQTSENSSVNSSNDPSLESFVKEADTNSNEEYSGFADCTSLQASLREDEEFPSLRVHLSRCHSSSETVEANRRILEQRRRASYNNDSFTTRKCSSSVEIVKHYPSSTWYVPSPVSRDFLCPREYYRSDSVSTSGLGSEISDSDAFMEVQSICDSFAPDECNVADDGVFTEMHLSPHLQKPLLRPSSLMGISAGRDSDFGQEAVNNGCSLVPFTVETRPDGTYNHIEKKDSGCCNMKEPSTSLCEHHLTQDTSTSYSTGDAELKVSQELKETLSLFEKQAAEEFAELRKEIGGLKEGLTSRIGSRDLKENINLLTTDSEQRKVCLKQELEKKKQQLSQIWTSLKPQEYKGKDSGLYRVQSCPGIVGTIQQTPSYESVGLAAALVSDLSPTRLRGCKATKAEKAGKVRNRYSCGSLDHNDYEKFSFDFLPEFIHAGSCQKETDSPHSSSSSMSHSCGPFAGNLSIIQVS